MAIGVNSVLSMGVGALFASQANIQTTGNNISNVNTEGYSRQAVVLQERYSINYYPGQVGQGVQAQEIIRYFDTFIEKNYLSKLTDAARYQAQYGQLRYVDNLFNESNVNGIYNAISEMFKGWSTLAQEANSVPAREALLGQAKTLTQSLNKADATLRDLENQMNTMIQQEVENANKLMREIAALNKEINANYLEGRNNPNALMDMRDAKVRELATIIDVDVQDRGPGQYMVTMKNGNTLVQNETAFSLKFTPPSVENNLIADSPFKAVNGTAHFSGRDSFEYTLEMVTDYIDEDGNPVVGATEIGGNPPARFKVSLDGGRSWLTDDNGQVQLFNAQEQANGVRVGALEIWFDAGDIAQGDRFVISPKSDVFWVTPTSGPINVSTQIFADGSDNPSRITGGSLAGLLEFRDHDLGEYRDRLDSLAKSIVWEVNRIHSQGAGLQSLTSLTGTYVVGNINQPLGSPEARFTWADRLQSGNMTFSIFDADGNPVQPYPSLDVFDSLGNFDPSAHDLNDVKAAIDATRYLKATIVDGKLQVSVNQTDYPGHSFAITADTTGLAAALGLNTFFTGDDAQTIAVNDALGTNLNLVNSGRLDVLGQLNSGDNQTAAEIAALTAKAVEIGTTWNKKTSQSLAEYYGNLITRVGADTAGAKYTAATETAIAQDLYDRQEEISGVNLDEEMSNLIKFQASYKAAAKLITTADEMLQTLLSLKQ